MTTEATREQEDVWGNLGVLIAQRRETLGLSKSEAARRAQISATTWRLMEHGSHDSPSNSTLVRIARALRMDPVEMLGVVGRHPSHPAGRVTTPDLDAEQREDLLRRLRNVEGISASAAHDQAFVDAIEDNPRLDVTARALLMNMYQVLVERGR